MSPLSHIAVIVLCAAVPASAAAESRSRLVTAEGLVAWLEGPHARIYDLQGRLLTRLPPTPRTERREASGGPPAKANARAVADKVLDDADISGADRDDDFAEELIDDELSLAARRAARTRMPAMDEHDDAPARPAWPAWGVRDGRGLTIGAGGSVWRVRAGHAPVEVGPAPGPAHAAAMIGGGWLILATDTGLRASRDGRAFQSVPLAGPAPLDLVGDATSSALALRFGERVALLTVAARKGQLVVVDGAAYDAPAPVLDVAVCGGRWFALSEEGLSARTDDAGFVPIAPATRGRRLTCGAASGSILAYGPGLSSLALSNAGATPAPWQVGANEAIDAATVVDATLWIASPGAGLVRVERAGERHAVADQATTSSSAPSPPRLPSPAITQERPWSTRWLPQLTVVGRLDARAHERRQVGLALVANWQIGRLTPGVAAHVVAADAAALAQFAAQSPGASPPVADGQAPVTYLGPDRDIGCLQTARQQAVVRASAEPGAAQSLITRAGRSAWLPELRLRAERQVGRSESVDFKPTAANDALGLDTDSDVRYEVRAIWDLPRLVFNPEELGAHQQAARIADVRREIESQVNRLYFERRRLLAIPAAATPDDAATWQIRLEEIEADLDTLSGGGFSRCRAGILQARPSRS